MQMGWRPRAPDTIDSSPLGPTCLACPVLHLGVQDVVN